MSGPEIRGRLVLDDAASATTEKIAHGLSHIDERVRHTTGELGGLMRQAVATALGFQFDRGIHSAMELGHEVFGAANEMRETQKALAGVVMMTDKTGMSFEGALDKGYALHEELEMIGVKAGVAGDSMMEAFQSIAARSKKSTEEVTRFLEMSATVGRVVPGGLAGITAGFANIEMGVIRARNPVVQLVAASGILGSKLHNAREVAKAMMKMSQEDQLKTAEAAIARMHEKVKDMPLTFSQLSTSMKGMREQVMVAMGEPLLRALTPPLQKLQQYFLANKESIEHWAKSVGEKVGEWMTSAAESFRDGFQYLQSHADEIAGAIKSAMHTVREVVNFLLEHKETIGIMFGAKLGIGAGMGAVNAAMGLGGALSCGAGASAFGRTLGPAAAAGAAGALSVVIVGSVAVAIDELVKLYKITDGFSSDAQQSEDARRARMFELAGKHGATDEDKKELQKLEHSYRDNAAAAGLTTAEVNKFVASLSDLRAAVQGVDAANAAALAGMQGDEGMGQNVQAVDANQWINAYNTAIASGNDALVRNAMLVLGKNEWLAAALMNSADKLAGGYDALSQTAEKFGLPMFGKGAREGVGGAMPKIAHVAMNGGQTFHIKQDFKDKDPDRIALIFRRDIAKAALTRTASRFGSPFGI
jgi:hypothetical protein